ncbi:Nn.00g112510.m01.CDS01 [Neocucurbitaria sp. VM-36]
MNHRPPSSSERKCLQGSILAIPGGRGSCSGSGVILELLLNGKGPLAILFERREDILTLGVVIAEEIFGQSIPVVVLDKSDFSSISTASHICIEGNRVFSIAPDGGHEMGSSSGVVEAGIRTISGSVELSEIDKAFLKGSYGEAARLAMRIILRMAEMQGVDRLLNVTQVHIDGCIYTGPASLAFAEKLRALGGKTVVPTSLNSNSVDQRRWRAQGVESSFGQAAERLAAAYVDMGARPTFTCAPYLLDTTPKRGEQIAWAESNTVVFANSVLGAKTMKYPDFLVIAIALTGRAPEGGLHIDANRLASFCVLIPPSLEPKDIDDSFYPLLGYHVGRLSGQRIPVILGLDRFYPQIDDLKAFGAAFVTVSSAPMFHIVVITPEATSLDAVTSFEPQMSLVKLDFASLNSCSKISNSAEDGQHVELVSLGNPHFSFAEMRKLAPVCLGKRKQEQTAIVVTCGRSMFGLASQAGLIAELEKFGVEFITDTCWCMIGHPIIP